MAGRWRGLIAGCASLALAACVWCDPVLAQVRQSPVDLVQIALNAPSKVTPGKKFRALDTVESVGDSPAATSVTYYYLSLDDVIDEADVVLGGRRVPPLPRGSENQDYAMLTVPANTEPGDYFLIVRANATRAVDERYLDNNQRSVPLTVVAPKRK